MPIVAQPTSSRPTAVGLSDCDYSSEDECRSASNGSAEGWAAELVQEALQAPCTTIGLVSGNRQGSDRCVIDAYARLLAQQLQKARFKRPLLIVRLHTQVAATAGSTTARNSIPRPAPSPLGAWSDVHINVAVGRKSPGVLQQLPQWLPSWKTEYGFLLIDLGPICELPSRVAGRLCDGCYVMLGPETCGSYEWLMRHIAWHDRSGSTMCGTLLTTTGD